MDQTELAELLAKYRDDTITIGERQRLLMLLETEEGKSKLDEIIYTELQLQLYTGEPDEKIGQLIHKNVNDQISSHERPHKPRTVGIRWLRYAAAAAIAIVLTGSYFYFTRPAADLNTVKTNKPAVPANISPGTDKAVLTLADGSVISLHDATSGQLASQAGVRIRKTADGKIIYSAGETPGGIEQLFNTMSTPKGGQYELVLPDGTKVWLNAASYIKFPVPFSGKKRDVEIGGEAYFEVAADKNKPFEVNVAGTKIEVLGTHFNVNAYGDENKINATLVEGAVRIRSHEMTQLLEPGQQAQVTAAGGINVRAANVEEAIAWKNGLFYFIDADLRSVMQQLGRWYNMEIEYQGKIPKRRFEGKIQRSLNLSEVLESLSKNDIQFTIEENKIIVH